MGLPPLLNFGDAAPISLARHKTAVLGTASPHSRGGGPDGQAAKPAPADYGRGGPVPPAALMPSTHR